MEGKNAFKEDKNILEAMDYIKQENKEFYDKTNKKKLAIIITYGCQMNVHDSEKLLGMLEYMDILLQKIENKQIL